MKKSIKELSTKASKNINTIKGGLTDEEREILDSLGGSASIKKRGGN